MLAGVGGVRGPGAHRAELRRAAVGEVVTAERQCPGSTGATRMLPSRRPAERSRSVGQSLDDRDETLGGLVTSFALGGPIAVVLASVLGYTLAAVGLRPVEAMRRRAQEVSLTAATSGSRYRPPATRSAGSGRR